MKSNANILRDDIIDAIVALDIDDPTERHQAVIGACSDLIAQTIALYDPSDLERFVVDVVKAIVLTVRRRTTEMN